MLTIMLTTSRTYFIQVASQFTRFIEIPTKNMNSDDEKDMELLLCKKLEKIEREFIPPGVKLSIKQRTDGGINYIRRCKKEDGAIEYNGSWGVLGSYGGLAPFPVISNGLPSTRTLVDTRSNEEESENKEVGEDEGESEDETEENDKKEEESDDDELVVQGRGLGAEDNIFLSSQELQGSEQGQAGLKSWDLQSSQESENLAQEGTKNTAVATPSPKAHCAYCTLCDSYPCVWSTTKI